MSALTLRSPMPLRNTTAWGAFGDVETLAHGYGAVRITPTAYNEQLTQFVLLDHAILGVDEVTRDDLAASFEWRNTPDSTGRMVSLLSITPALDSGEQLAARVRGKADPLTGGLMTNPALIVWDLLANLAGQPVTRNDLANFIAECDNAGLAFHGLFDNAGITVRGQLAELMQNCGAQWSRAMPGLARLWPL